MGAVVHAQEGAGDFDNDCLVSEDDFLAFLACRSGPTGGLLDPECWRGDLDGDGDVDIDDFHAFQEFYGASLAGETGACCLPDDSCVQLTCSQCIAQGGLFVAPGAVSCDIAVCCQADLRTDSDNDGDIDDDDEAVEDLPPGVVFPVNSDDDNENGIPDMDEDPVVGEDDLAEMQLSTSCDPTVPGSASWSLSWPVADPPLLQIWEDPEKFGDRIENDVQYAWPPPASVWAEAMGTFELDLTFTIWVDDTRAQKKDKVKATVSCTFGRKYAQAIKSGSATGCSARIRTCTTALCGEPQAKSDASSNAWVGATRFIGDNPVKWIQTGYARDRLGGSTYVVVHRYAETQAGPLAADYDIHFGSAPAAGTHEYKCYLMSSLLDWVRYEYDTGLWYQWQHSGLRNMTGTDYHWSTEIFNKQDQMVGTAAAKCDFTECMYSLSWGAFQNANITTGDLYTDDASEWGIGRVSATAFNVWDKNP